MGPLPTSSKGNHYILTDLFTKWVEAFPLCSTVFTVLAIVLVVEIVCRYGVPIVIHSDQGTNLTSLPTAWNGAYQDNCISPTRKWPHREIKPHLGSHAGKGCQANQRDWDTHLPKVLLAYRTAIHESTQFTPYHLTFGRSPMLPVDIMLRRQPSKLVKEGEVVKLPQFVEETHQYFNDAHDTVRSNLNQAHQRQKLAFDKKEHGETFQVGDRVWLYTPAVKEGRSKKLDTEWCSS